MEIRHYLSKRTIKPVIRCLFLFVVVLWSVRLLAEKEGSIAGLSKGQLPSAYSTFLVRDPAMRRVLELSKNKAAVQKTLAFLQSTEAVLGSSRTIISGVAEAGEIADVVVSYILPFDLNRFDLITIRQHWIKKQKLQIDEPSSPGYVSLLDNSDFKLSYFNRSGVYGGLDSVARVVGFRVAEDIVPAGTEVKFLVSALELPHQALTRFELPLFLEKDGLVEIKIPGKP